MNARKKLLYGVEIAIALLVLAFVIVLGNWPFSQQKITKTLSDHFHGQVEVRGFHSIYFPHPGCVLDDVVIRHPNDDPRQPFVTAKTLTIVGHYTDFLRRPRHLHLLDAEGLEVNYRAAQASPGGSQNPLSPGKGKKLIVETFRTRDAVFHFGDRSFPVHLLEVTDFGGDDPAKFNTALTLPIPHGELQAHGTLGPLSKPSMDADYSLQHANFSGVPGVSGDFSTSGHASGDLHAVQVKGSFDSPNFTVAKTEHPVHLTATYDAFADATSGNVRLTNTDLDFRRSQLHAVGTISGSPKIADIHFDTRQAHIEDLLYLFLDSKPGITGPIALKAHTVLPPGKQKFMQRLQMDGDFKITQLDFRSPDTKDKVNQLSVSAKGDPDSPSPPDVNSTLAGEVSLRNGNARLTNLEFIVPSAHAIGNGTYNLLNKQIDVRGRLLMDTHLSNATTGWKSVLLKPFNGLFKGKRHGSAIGVSMTGTYPHPQFKTSMDPDRYESQTKAHMQDRHPKPQPR